MRHLQSLLPILLLGLSLVSCHTPAIVHNPEENLTPEEQSSFPKLEIDQQSFDDTRKKVLSAIKLAAETDIAISSGKKPFPTKADDKGVENLWNSLYDAIGHLNGLMEADREEMHKAEILYGIALCYGELLYFWEKVPIWATPSSRKPEDIPAADRVDVAQYVIDCARLSAYLIADNKNEQPLFAPDKIEIDLIISQAVLQFDNYPLAMEGLQQCVASQLYFLPEDGISSPVGQYGMYSPAAANSYVNVLLYCSWAKFHAGDYAGALVLYNQILQWQGLPFQTELSLSDIESMIKSFGGRLLWLQRETGELPPGTNGFFPVP